MMIMVKRHPKQHGRIHKWIGLQVKFKRHALSWGKGQDYIKEKIWIAIIGPFTKKFFILHVSSQGNVSRMRST